MSQIESTIMCGRKSSISTKTDNKDDTPNYAAEMQLQSPPLHRLTLPSLPPYSRGTLLHHGGGPPSSLNSSALLPLVPGTSTGEPHAVTIARDVGVTYSALKRLSGGVTRRARAGTATTPSPAAGAAARSARRAEIVFSFSEIFFIACWWLCVNSSMRRRCCSIVLRRTSSRLAAWFGPGIILPDVIWGYDPADDDSRRFCDRGTLPASLDRFSGNGLSSFNPDLG